MKKIKELVSGDFTEEELDDINCFIIAFRRRHHKDIAIITDKNIKLFNKDTIDLDKLKDIVCNAGNLSPIQLRSKSRRKPIVVYRHLYCFIARGFGHTFKNIGDHIGRDHTTALYGVNCTIDYIKKGDLDTMTALSDFLAHLKENKHTVVEHRTNNLLGYINEQAD